MPGGNGCVLLRYVKLPTSQGGTGTRELPKPSHTARFFHFLPLVYISDNIRYNAINMINTETRQDIGYVTISKRKLRQIIEAINAGATVEQVKAELERMIE